MTETLRLGDHCVKIGSGATPRGGKEVYLDNGPIALIRSQNIHNNYFSRDGLAFISHEQAAQLQNVEVKEGDVLLNITGDSVARVCQVDNAVLPASEVAPVSWTPDLWSFRSPQWQESTRPMRRNSAGR
jgi:type I restriction enzyme, S subunit